MMALLRAAGRKLRRQSSTIEIMCSHKVTTVDRTVSAVKVRELRFDDHAQITALEARYDLGTKNYDEWKYLWNGNPAFREGWPLGWVLENADQAIVGHLSNIPLSYELNGHRLVTATGRGWVVHRNYRAHSLLLLKEFYRNKCATLYLNTSANASSARALELFGSKRVPAGRWDASTFWVTRYPGFAESFLQAKMPTRAGYLRYPVAAALFASDLLKKSIRRQFVGIPVTQCGEFDDRFEMFWHELRARHSHLLLADRSKESLTWHFKFAIAQKDVWIATVVQNSELRAYAIFLRQDNPQYRLRRMRLVDYQSLEHNDTYLASLVSWAVEKCKRERIDMLEHVGLADAAHVPGHLPAHTRKLPSWTQFYRATDSRIAAALTSPNVWAPSLYDGDASL